MIEWIAGALLVGLSSYEVTRQIKIKKKYKMSYRYIRILQHEDNISITDKIKHMITVIHEYKRTWLEKTRKGREWFRLLIYKDSNGEVSIYLGFPEDRINGIKTTLKNTYPLIEMHDTAHADLPLKDNQDKNVESGYFELQKKGAMSGLSLQSYTGGDGLEDVLLAMESDDTDVWFDILFTPESNDKLKRNIRLSIKDIKEKRQKALGGSASKANLMDEFTEELKKSFSTDKTAPRPKQVNRSAPRKLTVSDLEPEEISQINAMKKRYVGRETQYQVTIRLLVRGQYASAVAQTVAANVRAQFQMDNGLRFVRRRAIRKKILETVPYYPAHIFLLTGDELANVVRLPDAKHRVMEYVPHLKKGQRSLDPDELSEGISIGKLIHPTLKGRNVRISHRQMNKHFILTGKTGSGKSSALMEMLQSLLVDWQANSKAPGFTFLDPARDTVATILNRLMQMEAEGKEVDWNRVHYFNLGDPEYSLGLNLLYSKPGESPDDVVETALGMITRTYGGLNAPQMERVIRNCLTTLVLDTEPHVILGIIPLLRDPRFRARVLARITEPTIKEFWRFEFPPLEEKLDQVISPILNRLSSFNTNVIMRRMFGQPLWKLSIRKWMDEGHIVLFDFRGVREQILGLAGEHIVNQYHAEFQGRSTSAKTHYFIADEAHRTPYPIINKMIAEDRKFGLALGFSTQFPEQLPPDLLKSFKEITGNVMTTTLGSESAGIVAKASAGKFNAQYLQDLPERVVAVYTGIDRNGVTEQTTFTVMCPPPYLFKPDGSGVWANHLDQDEMKKALEWGLDRGRELQARDSTLGTVADEIIHQYLRPGTPLQVSKQQKDNDTEQESNLDTVQSNGDQDELYDQAVQIIAETQQASVSLLQRRLRIGYTRAARIIDAMEDKKIIGPYEGTKPREVLITLDSVERIEREKPGKLGVSFFDEIDTESIPEVSDVEDNGFDDLYDQALKTVTEKESATVDLLQQELRIDEKTAQSLIIALEQFGEIGPEVNGEREIFSLPGVPSNKEKARDNQLSRWM